MATRSHPADPSNVLIIDDDEGVRHVFARVLTHDGFRPLLAEDGERGLAMIRESHPDAVLLDLQMPGLSGLEVLSELSTEAPDMPAIVISGSGVMDDVVQALRRGAWDYVMKPVGDARLITRALRGALERAALLRENREQRASLEHLNRELTHALTELQGDQEAGRGIQFQLLPADGMRIGAYRLTRRLFPSRYLSGDFIDYFPIGSDHLAFYVADVSGHGAASAFVTAMLATLVARHLEAFARGETDAVLEPARLLESLDRELGLQRFRKHVTMFYAVVDLRADRLVYSSAGHYPFPLLETAEGVTELELSGRPLGLLGDGHYVEHAVALGSVRRMLLASDGVLEVLPPGSSRARLDALAARFRDAENLDALVVGLGAEPTARPPDDIALLWLERRVQHG